jgi:hypothetical protein
MKPTATPDELRAVMAYNPDTGVLTWIARTAARIAIGDSAGTVNGSGYLQFQFKGRQYQAHRVAWLLKTGEWPSKEIDHANGIRTDNRWCNLRQATDAQNVRNSGARSTNKLGIKGVRYHPKDKRFHARITHEGIRIYLGAFATPDEASEAYKAAARRLHGEFFNSTGRS